MTFNPKINGDYKLHRSSGRWVQSLLEMDVAHLLHQTSTPFCSGWTTPALSTFRPKTGAAMTS